MVVGRTSWLHCWSCWLFVVLVFGGVGESWRYLVGSEKDKPLAELSFFL